jgi:thiol:disulfide interchange protein
MRRVGFPAFVGAAEGLYPCLEMMRFGQALLGMSLGLLALGGTAFAQNGALPDTQPKVHVSLIPERAAIAPGATITVALKEDIRKDWHTYWINPGDAGEPTRVAWKLPEGWQAAPFQWPYPRRIPVGPLMDYGYDNQVALLAEVTAPATAKPGETVTLAGRATWLVCSEVCVPEGADVSLSLPVAAALPPADEKNAALFAETRAKLPHASPWNAVFDAGDTRFALLVESPELAKARPREANFYPYTDGHIENAAPVKAGTTANGLVIESKTGYKLQTAEKRAAADKVGGILVLTGADGRTDALEISAMPGAVPASAVLLASASDLGLPEALLFAFLGGLILNLMPCVFPVLSMKALALAAKREKPEAARLSALAYGAGVLASFAALAAGLIVLREGGAAIGWGFQLQQPMFVAFLALLMFAVGLNLSGLYEIGGARLMGAGQTLTNKSGAAGSFFTGVLAVVVATPCTAPFMGAAMGFALTQSAGFALAVFVALGAGFAAPFMALGLIPAALRVLPRPGAWMTILRQLLAFPMYGAAIWLVWVLSFQAGSDGVLAALAGALTLSFGLWAYGRAQTAQGSSRIAGLVAATLAIGCVAAILPFAGISAPSNAATAAAGESTLGYEPYSAAKLASLRAEGRPVFINATAAWCITCLVNERIALSGDALQKAFSDKKVAALKADWTNEDAEVTALLSAQGRSGVPLYLYFAPGAESPVVLPQLLTEGTMLAVLSR